jgi:signal transduction histidine kinase/ActR/RegA family two-component response regulator
MKVRAHLVLMAGAILVPVMLFSAAALIMLLHAEREAALRGMRETARATALIVDRELAEAEAALRVLATSHHLAIGDFQNFYKQALVANTGEGAWTVLFDRDGQQRMNTRLPFGTALPGRVPPDHRMEVLQAQSPRVSNLMSGALPGRYVVTMEVPVALDGRQRYVLAQAFFPEYFNRAFSQPDIPSSWIIGIIDREGITVTRTHKAEEFRGKPVKAEILQAARAMKEGEIRNISRDGVDIYTVFTRSAWSGWTIAVGVPVAEIESSARRAVLVASFGLLAAIACAVGMASLFGRRLVRSIAGAAQSAAALGRGEMPVSASSGVAEVDKLHAALSEAGGILLRERESLKQAEAERARLFVSEHEARTLAEEQNKAKDEFLAMLGHELRNPLSAISSAVAVMESAGARTESISHARAVIRRQSQHLGRIVDDLLDLSRMMTGKILLDKHYVNLAESVQACVDVLHATGRTEHYKLDLHTETVWVHADPTRLEQIVNNLIINALKYTPAGGHIDVHVHAENEDAVLVVRDSGIGIASELLPYVFDVFVQGAASLDRAQGGLGIGLTLVRQLATMHGGMVTAASAGRELGSTFTVRLPRSTELAVGMSDTAAAATGPAHTVLLIEDNDDGRMMMSTMLSLYGHRVLQAADGIEGLRVAAMEKPDVAVVDIGLAGMDGYEIARRLRADPHTCRIGLIALTGYGQEADRQRALDAGFDVHLVKPVDMEYLKEMIVRCAAGR